MRTGVRIAVLALGACANSEAGRSAFYHPDVKNPPQVRIPANAPPIAQQFRSGVPNADDHLGFDLLDAEGTPVLAAASGRVVRSFFGPAYGNQVWVDHGPDADGVRVMTKYVHVRDRLVNEGQSVTRGQQIATLGHTGVLAGGLDHLHFELWRTAPRRAPKAVDPNLYWVDGPGQIRCPDPARTVAENPARISFPLPCR